MGTCTSLFLFLFDFEYFENYICFLSVSICLATTASKKTTGWLLYGGPEKTKDCVQAVPPINKLPYEILQSTSLATQKNSDLLCSASHRPDLGKRL